MRRPSRNWPGWRFRKRPDWIRALILEMGRINSYLMYLGGQAGAFGQGVIGQWTTYARDLMLDRFEELTGARIYHMFILPGGVRDDLPDGFDRRMEETLQEIESTLQDVLDSMFHNAVFKKRAVGLGYVDPALVRPVRRHRAGRPWRRRRQGRAQRSALPDLRSAGIRAGHWPRLGRLSPVPTYADATC